MEYRTNSFYSISGTSLLTGHHSNRKRVQTAPKGDMFGFVSDERKTPLPSIRAKTVGIDESCKSSKIQDHKVPHVRCITPVSNFASEAHIHRIRSANSQAEFKNQSKIGSSLINLPKVPYQSKPWFYDEQENGDDIESVDWSAPLDITTYLYKPEYIIGPKVSLENTSVASTDKDASKMTLPFDESESEREPESARFPCVGVGKSGGSLMKADIVQDYIKSSMRSARKVLTVDRRISDCTVFARNISNDIRQVKADTKRLEMYSPRAEPWGETNTKGKNDILERGYNSLKKLYELNPELTESAAEKHVLGPPGNHWMGLSRVEVQEIMERILQEFGIKIDSSSVFYRNKDSNVHLRALTAARKRRVSGNISNKVKDKRHGKKNHSSKEPKALRLKYQQMMPKHVPGPKHLHSNICIRPWEPSLDGWSQDDDYCAPESDRQNSVKRSTSRTNNSSNPQNSPKTVRSFHPDDPISASQNNDRMQKDNEWEGEGEYITLEIFSPVFRVSRT